jgi:hypothetical protein
MSTWIVPGFRVVSDIGIGVHPTRVILHVVRTHKPPAQRIVIPEVIIEQPRLTIQAFAGIGERGRRAAPLIIDGAIGTIVLQADDLPNGSLSRESRVASLQRKTGYC